MSTATPKRPVALITGATSGIGLELARMFAHEGNDLVIVARNETRLGKVADELRERFKVNVVTIAADLAQPDAADGIARRVADDGIAVEYLVNNAGFATFGLFANTDIATELQLLQVNVVALTHLTKLLLPAMLARGSGRILNLGSTAAFLPGPLMAVYYASKAYVLSFSDAIANEVRGTGVTVSVLCPGATRTGFQERGTLTRSRLVQGEIAGAAAVAEAGYRGLMRGQTVIVPGFANKLVPLLARLAPRALAAQLARRAQEPVKPT